jgi:RNA polymerase sigma-70 factor (ECF subfamily)
VASAEQSRFEELLSRYGQALRRLAWSYTRNSAEGDDLFQEIALALWTALPRFRGDCSERTWAYRVAHNTAISFFSGNRRRSNRETAVTAGQEPVSAANPESDAIDQQKKKLLWDAIRELPLQDRQIVVLYLDGFSAAETEAVTGVSQGNVATRLTRMRQRLAARVREAEVNR